MTQIGDRIKQNYGWATVTEYYNATDIIITFDDGTEVRTEAGQFRNGKVKNYNAPSIMGVGVVGYGTYSRKTHPSLYSSWQGIIRYCYSSTARDTMDPRWHHFQYFCEDLSNMLNYDKLGDWMFVNIDRIFNQDESVHWNMEKIVIVPNVIAAHNRACNGNHLPKGVNEWGSPRNKRRYYAAIEIDGVTQHLGSYHTVDEALCAYNEAKLSRAKQLCNLYPSIDPRIIERLCTN